MTASDASLQMADQGSGPLLQRDYWAVLSTPDPGPRAVARSLFERFCALAPPDLLRFIREDAREGPLAEGEFLTVEIERAGVYGVQVVDRSDLSLTLATEKGHPEAGRITFGVYPNANGETVVHIRSRARAGSPLFALGFPAAGKALQTTAWTGFLDRLAAAAGPGLKDAIHVETREVQEKPEDRQTRDVPPTFRAVDDGAEDRGIEYEGPSSSASPTEGAASSRIRPRG